MRHKFVGLGFFLLFLGLVMFNLSINIINRNPGIQDPPGSPSLSRTVWGLIGFVSSISVFVGALVLFITLLVFLVDKVHPPKIRANLSYFTLMEVDGKCRKSYRAMAYSTMVVVTNQTIFHSKTYPTETSQSLKAKG